MGPADEEPKGTDKRLPGGWWCLFEFRFCLMLYRLLQEAALCSSLPRRDPCAPGLGRAAKDRFGYLGT